ncbi:MAG: HAMP domain-containing sensor histidine kinase, partial [Campylobacterota bacterium]|nr:HAMP domain-containing sensor histidine kinase [Campylobacterota bacterium]
NGQKIRLSTFVNISELKKKDKLLFEQSKLAAMGEMIGNIAHQWRQPLSVISTGVTGMMIQKEHNILTDKVFFETCNSINSNTQYLLETIDNFGKFIKDNREKTIFNLSDEIDSFLHLVEGSIKICDIDVILNLQNGIQIDNHQNKLTQCLINIFNNAKDILEEKAINKKYIFISTMKKDKKAVIKIKDNGGGIAEKIIDKIFEPYFTTKHQSQGTGLGLHATYNLIVDGMGGTIEANNDRYEYKGEKYNGAEFTITL